MHLTFFERLIVAAAEHVHATVPLEPGPLNDAVCALMFRGAAWRRSTIDLRPLIEALRGNGT